jgi:hypothetical protein
MKKVTCRVLAAVVLCACLFPAPCWSGQGFAEGESRRASTELTSSDFEKALAKLTPLSPDGVRKFRLLFYSDSPVEQRQGLNVLLQKVGTLSLQAGGLLRLALLSPDASVRWMSLHILVKDRSAPPPLVLFARLLGDDSRDVQSAAEQALVAAGHPAILTLAQVVTEEPCYSQAKKAATRLLGTLGDECGIEAVANALVMNQGGCYDHETAFKALRQMGLPAVETLVALLRYRLLKGGAYIALLEYDPAALKSALLPLVVDPDIAIDDRRHCAEQAEILLGTTGFYNEVAAVYLGLDGEKSFPPEIIEMARRAWIDRPPRPTIVEALTRERVERDYAARHFIAEDEALAESARINRQTELAAAREAKAATDAMGASSNQFESSPSRSIPARLSPSRSSISRRTG